MNPNNISKATFWTRAGNRLAARSAARSKSAKGFVSQPEPRTIGHFGRGKQLVSGNFLMAGQLVEAPDRMIWEISGLGAEFTAAAQGFAWLDDLAAVGDAVTRRRAQDWTWGWIATYGQGRGPGWTPDLTGRRLIRWINHALWLLNGKDKAQTDAFYWALSAQTRFLAQRWKAAGPGLPRFEALTGLIYAGLSLTGMDGQVGPAVLALGRECKTSLGQEASIPTRNPEELSEVFALLSWASQALGESNVTVPAELLAAMGRMAPTVRALRHSDGGLARFHGGDRGLEGRIDTALAAAGVRALPTGQLAMGFARLHGGRTTVVADAAAPPSAGGHASTLGFELTSGRRPLIVSCGPGADFGADWHSVSRATASHSTLVLDGYSSSRFATGDGAQDRLATRAQVTLARPSAFPSSVGVQMAHAGWSRTHGLTHSRDLVLSLDGRQLSGQDELAPVTPAERKRFETVLAKKAGAGLPYNIRFHLHPDVGAEIDLGGTAVSLMTKSGEVWIFRFDPGPTLSLEPSVYMETGRLKPRPTRQIVLTDRMRESEARVVWTLAKAQDTPLAIRDTESD